MSIGRAALYVDGFNFYYGVTNHYRPLREELGYSLSGLCWCNFRALIERNFAGSDLLFVKYFTAPVTGQVARGERPGEQDRYALWRAALATVPGLRAVEGRYQPRGEERPTPGAPAPFREEKQTDVQIGIEMVLDASDPALRLDTLFLLSSDQDLWPAVWACALRVPEPKEVRILLPPQARKADVEHQLQDCAFRLGQRAKAGEAVLRHRAPKVAVHELDEGWLANALLPYRPAPDIECPEYWRLHHSFLDRHCRPKNRPDRPPVA
jgi:uncharacterized LabA/DUF88 family protein